VIGSDGNILDGYHRVNVAKALRVPTLKAWVGVKKQGVSEGYLNEHRKGLYNFIKNKFPTWPEYVLKDFLYSQAKHIQNQEELKDWLDRNQRDFGQVKWRLEKLPITIDIFTPKTQRMIKQREGGSSNPFQVPRDAERHAQQLKMIQQQGVRTEPIIVAKLNNGYDLIEGWHRTIQHLQQFPEGYTGPAWVAYGATYTSESKQGVAESVGDDDVDQITNDFIKHYSDDPLSVFMQAKASYLFAVERAKDFSNKADDLYRSHGDMSREEFQNTVMKYFGKHLRNNGFPKHASKDWEEAEHQLRDELMNSDQQDVTESLDQPYRLAWSMGVHGDVDAYTTLPDGTSLSIMFNQENEHFWTVEFYRSNSQGVTGEGDSQRIFATVLRAIKKFIKKYQPRYIVFSAVKEDDPTGSRTRLYERMVQKYARQLDYEIEVLDEGYRTTFTLYQSGSLNEQDVAEGAELYPEVLYHGSTQEIKGPLTPRQAKDIGGHPGSNKNAIYATDDPNFAIAYSLAERGSDTGTFGWKKEPRLIFFGGKIRHGENVYIHVLPTKDDQGRPLFARGGADAEWYSLPEVKEIMPIKVITKPVDQYLHLLRKPTPEEQNIFQTNKAKAKQGVAENFADGRNPGRKGLSRRVGIPKKATLGQLEKIAKSSTGERRRMAQWQLNMRRGRNKQK
jgi:hypothetical protein